MTVATLAPAFLRLGALSDGEDQLRQRLIGRLRHAQIANRRQQAYYEGARELRDLGIAIPPHLRDVPAVAAFPEIVVDVIDERMDWLGWHADDDEALNVDLAGIYRANHLRVESGQAVLESLVCGVSFLVVGTGRVEDDEPDVLVTAESASRMTASWSPRRRRATEALVELFDGKGSLSGWKLYLPDVTVTVERVNGRLVVTDRDEHDLGRVPVAVLLNRPRAGRQSGRSEITRAIRSHTDSAMRTLLGMEVSREFYGAPQRAAMGADETMFQDEDGKPVSQWAAMIGRMLMLPRDENGEIPEVTQFPSASPQPFTEVLRTYAQLVSAASGVPATHLGFTTDNPASADAIREANSRLDKRAIKRASQYDLAMVELAELCLLWRDGEAPEPGVVASRWSDPSTPTPAAAADRTMKLVASGVLRPEWDVTLEGLGFSAVDIRRIQADRRRTEGSAALRALRAARETPTPDAPTLPVTPVDAVNG